MTKRFVVLTQTRVDRFYDRASINDVDGVEIDARPWQDENSGAGNILTATWTVEKGQATISGTSLTSNVAGAAITYSQAGKVLISILLATATFKKKVWLEVLVKDVTNECNEDGYEL